VPLEPGLAAEVTAVVGRGDTAVAVGSGDVEVLGTPRVLALLEAATVAAVAPELPPRATTVGTRVELDHLKATRVGVTVTARAELVAVKGRRLRFDVRLVEGLGNQSGGPGVAAARGTVERALVDRDRFPPRA
jgi:fluoroacetyl-CoA thioesterase